MSNPKTNAVGSNGVGASRLLPTKGSGSFELGMFPLKLTKQGSNCYAQSLIHTLLNLPVPGLGRLGTLAVATEGPGQLPRF